MLNCEVIHQNGEAVLTGFTQRNEMSQVRSISLFFSSTQQWVEVQIVTH